MKEKWANDMKLKLDGHQMAPPAGLWEGISSEMGLQQASAAKPSAAKPSAAKRYYLAAAAIILALAGFFGIYQFQQREPLPQVAQAVHPAQSLQAPEPPAIKAKSQAIRPAAPTAVAQPAKTKNTPMMQVEAVSDEAPQAVADDAPQQTAEAAPQSASVATKRQELSATDRHATAYYQNRQIAMAVPASAGGKWTIGLNASGGLLTSFNPHSSDLAVGQYEAMNSESTLPPTNGIIAQDDEYHHHLPVSVGLSLHYQLNARLALLSGINYTYLYSDVNSHLHASTLNSQQLHYLGIPVGLAWQLWSGKGFSLYLSGSAMLAKCLNEKPWQFSVSGAAGAEYAVSRQLGLYLEPSLGYFFNDGTSFQHYYKAHPLAPSIEFGLRLHISGK